jgi:hypothetical protein
MLKPVLTLAILIGLTASAQAGDRDRYYSAPPPPAGYSYYGTVNNYYGPVTIYVTPSGGYAYYPSYPSNGASYGGGYATAPQCDANCYGAGYDWSGGYNYSYGGAYAYPSYSNRYYGYPNANEYQRQSPWAGYNGGWDNGY